jgi:tRNA dimethylallyltransferase
MQKNLVVITGQTGTGKTRLALQLAQSSNAQLISADSRQIYKEMDIGTGKIDKPNDLEEQEKVYYLHHTPLYGINLINPTEQFSAGQFTDYAKNILKKNPNAPSIIVGGTAFYIKSLCLPDETITIPQDNELRTHLAQLEKILDKPSFVLELQKQLKELNHTKLEQMNNSDSNNPRRLARAIEVARATPHINRQNTAKGIQTSPWIALWAPKEFLTKTIAQRINEMLKNGFEEEVRTLSQKYGWECPGMQTIGYNEWKDYFNKTASKEDVVEKILTSHLQYARKQLMYLKRYPDIHWVDVSQNDWESRAKSILI